MGLELYKRGNYILQAETPWGLHEKQLNALALLNDHSITQIGYGGAARSGKSWVASEWLVMQCLSYPGVGYGLARKELKTLKRTTLKTLFKVLAKYGLRQGHGYNYHQVDSIISFDNGSEIFLIDTAYKPSDPLNLRFGGYELTGCVIDESNETQFSVIEILQGRCGFRLNDHYNLPPMVLETFNPDKGHVYTRYWLPFREKKETDDVKFIRALPSDNPDPQVKRWVENQIKNGSYTTVQRLVYGNFDYDDTKNKLIDAEAINDYFTNSHVKPTGVRYLTADIARLGKDYTVIRIWDGLRVIKRISIAKNLVTEAAIIIRELCDKYEVPMSRCIVDEDGVGGGVRDILNCVGFVANRTPMGRTNYRNLKAQCAFVMAEFFNNRKVYEDVPDKDIRERIRQELDWLREKDHDKESKIQLVPKNEIMIGRSPDDLDSIIMRGYFEVGQKF